MKFEFIRMPDSTGFGDYTESGQVIPVSLQGPQGRLHATACSSTTIRRSPAVASSGAFPRSSPSPTLHAEIDTLVGTLHYGPIAHRHRHHGLQAQGRRSRRSQGVDADAELPAQDHAACRRHARASASWSNITLRTSICKAPGPGLRRSTLISHALAPLAELPVLEIVSGNAHRRRPHARSRQGRARLSGLKRRRFIWKWRLTCV